LPGSLACGFASGLPSGLLWGLAATGLAAALGDVFGMAEI
jgi:hypothetical protein